MDAERQMSPYENYKRKLRWKSTMRKHGMADGSTYDEGHPLWELAQQHPNVDLSATENANGVTLSRIQVAPQHQGQGYGGAALRDLLAYADANGHSVALTPERLYQQKGMPTRALKLWYAEHGFVPNKGRNKNWAYRETMIRPPQ